ANDSTKIKIHKYTEKIIVHGIDNGFTRHISIYGKCLKKTFFVLTTLDQNNDSLSKFKLFYKKRKYKEIDKFKLLDSPSLLHFHDSRFMKMVELDSGKNFHCTFKIDCKNLMLFNSINCFSFYETDSARYEITIPKNLSIKYDSLYFDSLSFHNISYHIKNDSQLFKIIVKPYKVNLKTTYQNYPMLRLIIVTKDKEKKEEVFFNNWYLSNIEKISDLNSNSKRIIDSIADTNSDNKKLISLYYEFVKTQFKYLDVQVGMGAYIPRDVNLVLNNKQGDCKDLSNLLCAILKYKGFNSNLALAATNDYFCDFNFPSLCSGNHVICVVNVDTTIILLDPTNLNHKIGDPIQSLQGKTIFITGKDKPSYYQVPTLAPIENKYNIYLNLRSRNKTLEGDFKIITSGYISDDIKWISSTYSNKELKKFIKNKVSEVFHNHSIDSITKVINNDSIIIKGKIKYYNKYYISNNLIYLFIDYIPNLYTNSFHKNKILEKTLVGSTINKNFIMNITFNEKIKDIEYSPFFEKKDTYFLNFNVNKLNDKSICVNYSFVYNKIWINKSDIESVNSLIDNFNKKTHETVILHY
ncbi:MAG: hypothetical protein ACTSUG_01310, partial [Candidatus Helarchaeota archaeon]